MARLRALVMEEQMADENKGTLPDFLAVTNDEDRAIAEEYIRRLGGLVMELLHKEIAEDAGHFCSHFGARSAGFAVILCLLMAKATPADADEFLDSHKALFRLLASNQGYQDYVNPEKDDADYTLDDTGIFRTKEERDKQRTTIDETSETVH